MFTVDQIEAAWTTVVKLERDVKAHIATVHDDVIEQRHALVVYRHAHALRGALEQLSETRTQQV